MTKNEFRSFYAVAKIGMQVNYMTTDCPNLRSGTIQGLSKGRGRGGSLKMNIHDDATELLTTLSSTSSHMLRYARLIENGMEFGSTTDLVVNYNLKANPEAAAMVKQMFEKVLIDLKTNGVGPQTINLNAPQNTALHGYWKITGGRVLRGRSGQVALNLSQPNKNMNQEIWSRRISSVIVGARAMLSNGEVLDYGSLLGLYQ